MSKLGVTILIIVVLGGLGWYWYAQNQGDRFVGVAEANAVVVQDQTPGEKTVVTYAKLAQPGYVLVYSTDASGNKTLLGSSTLLTAGVHKNVSVRHSDSGSSKSGATITAAVVADNGDGVFSETDDGEVLVEDDAQVADDAVLDLEVDETELAGLLEEAGYEVTAEVGTSIEDDTMMEDDSAMEDDTMMDDGSDTTEDDSMMQDDTMMAPDEGATVEVETSTQ